MNRRKKRKQKSDHYSLRNRESEFAGGRARTLVTSTTSARPGSSLELGRAHTQILISAAVQCVCDRGARSTVTFKKKIPKCSLGS